MVSISGKIGIEPCQETVSQLQYRAQQGGTSDALSTPGNAHV
jgi:hypothetical protein